MVMYGGGGIGVCDYKMFRRNTYTIRFFSYFLRKDETHITLHGGPPIGNLFIYGPPPLYRNCFRVRACGIQRIHVLVTGYYQVRENIPYTPPPFVMLYSINEVTVISYFVYSYIYIYKAQREGFPVRLAYAFIYRIMNGTTIYVI